MLRIAVRSVRPLVVAWALAGCSTSSSGVTPGGGSSSGGGSSGSSNDSGSPSDDSGSTMGTQDSGGSADGAAGFGGGDSGLHGDGGSPHDGGIADGSSADGGTRDGGVGNIGSCCSTQTTPGCNDPNVELCVCQKIPSCCMTAWTAPCVAIVQQKYCQAGVRDCVCGTDAGQWAQTSCCSTDWNATCDSVATIKCGAAQGCF